MKKIAVILADGFEEVEGVSVIDLLRRATCKVEVFGVDNLRVTGSHGITIEAEEIFNYYNCLDFDGIVFVGGMKNAKTLSENSFVIDLINYYLQSEKLVAGICATPSLVFPKTEMPDGMDITCYPDEELIEGVNRFNFVDKNVVICNNVISSQSPFTAFEFALSIVDYLGLNAGLLLGDLQGKK